eukprot:3933745-Rhodomonas_salina.1
MEFDSGMQNARSAHLSCIVEMRKVALRAARAEMHLIARLSTAIACPCKIKHSLRTLCTGMCVAGN